MIRWIAVLACTMALALPMASGADAAKKARGKTCSSAAMDGKKVSWKCAADQKCCFDWLTGQGSCQASSAVCM